MAIIPDMEQCALGQETEMKAHLFICSMLDEPQQDGVYGVSVTPTSFSHNSGV